MVDKKQIEKLLDSLGTVSAANAVKISNFFGSLNYRDEEKQTILHILVDNKYDKYRCFTAIKSLLEKGLDPNATSDFDYNFIQTALYTGYSEDFILKIIEESLKYGLDVNHVDEDGDTIIHTAIYSDNYKGFILEIYKLLLENGFDSRIKNNSGYNIFNAHNDIKNIKKFISKEQINIFERMYKESIEQFEESEQLYEEIKKEKRINKVINSKPIDKSKLKEFGSILTDKEYITNPTIGREEELKNLMIVLAQDKKLPIVVGESGVGKTSLVEELAYRIQKDNVPNFLKDKIIVEINPNDLIAGKKYTGEFEKVIKNLMDICSDDRIILFIDEIHTIYGVGTHDKSDVDLAAMLKPYIDRSGVEIIGTTTNAEYDKYFSNDALKRRFERVVVKEPSSEVLYQIIDKVIDDYIIKTNIDFKDNNIKNAIIKIILEATSNNHRVYNDKLNNPDLAISIVDRAFATAKVFDDEYITQNNFIESFKNCSRLYENAKELAISKLEQLSTKVEKTSSKILKLDFNRKGKK